jgi:hypothetical protein
VPFRAVISRGLERDLSPWLPGLVGEHGFTGSYWRPPVRRQLGRRAGAIRRWMRGRRRSTVDFDQGAVCMPTADGE